jgi:hypothetical protein
MLRWISIFGGLLTMMGHHARSEALFYYFRLEDQVPENHLISSKANPRSSAFQKPSEIGAAKRLTCKDQKGPRDAFRHELL